MATTGAYYSRSWALLTKDKGWIKPLLVMGVASIVPIAGPLGVYGYALEWARLTAWGVDSAPKQKGVKVGECIKSGWRGVVVAGGWGILLMILANLLLTIADYNGLVGLLLFVVELFAGVIFAVCALRASIYQNFTAGYQVNRIVDMLKRDFGGIARIVGINLLISLIVGIVAYVIILITIFPALMQIVGLAVYSSSYGTYSYYGDPSYYVMQNIISTLTGMIPTLLVIGYIFSVIASFVSLIIYTSVGLWMRQFNVPAWGASSDPLPETPQIPAQASTPANPAQAQPASSPVPAPAPIPQDQVPTAVQDASPNPAPQTTPAPAQVEQPSQEAPAAAPAPADSSPADPQPEESAGETSVESPAQEPADVEKGELDS